MAFFNQHDSTTKKLTKFERIWDLYEAMLTHASMLKREIWV